MVKYKNSPWVKNTKNFEDDEFKHGAGEGESGREYEKHICTVNLETQFSRVSTKTLCVVV